ncbi:hypothetical protein Tco_1176217 [Tanacetum coccineum]
MEYHPLDFSTNHGKIRQALRPLKPRLVVFAMSLIWYLEVDGLIRLMGGENTGPINIGNLGEITMIEFAEIVKEKDLIKELEKQLNDEKLSVQQATKEMSVLRDELDRRESEYESMQNAFLKVFLKEKESKLYQAQDTLDEVNQEILNLKTLLSKKDNNLTETTTILKEKEEHIEKIQHDSNVTNLKYSEATTTVERINKVINSMGYEDNVSSKEKQLETELDVVKETLRLREGDDGNEARID